MTWQDNVMPWWAHTLYYSFDQPSVTWNRPDVEAMLLAHNAKMTTRVGHPFHYRLAPTLEPHQMRIVIGMLPLLARELEKLGEGEVAEPDDFAAALDQMRQVLGSASLGRHLVLELGEVLDTDEGILELIGGLADLDAQVGRALAG